MWDGQGGAGLHMEAGQMTRGAGLAPAVLDAEINKLPRFALI